MESIMVNSEFVSTANILFEDSIRNEQRDYQERFDNFRNKCAIEGSRNSSYYYRTLIQMECESIEGITSKWIESLQESFNRTGFYPSIEEIKELSNHATNAIDTILKRVNETLEKHIRIFDWKSIIADVHEKSLKRVERHLQLIQPPDQEEESRRIGFRQ